MVSGRKKGDDPDDAPDPALVQHTVHLELDAESHALWRDLRKGIEDELGRSLDDKGLIAELHGRAFAVAADPDDEVEPAAHGPRRMINISTCPDCRRAWQDGAGVSMQISATALERAQCDAIVCNNDRETPARRTIPERIRRKVMERDRWRCTFPGCRSSRNLEVHHVEHVADGGENEPANLTTLCGGHHGMHHDRVIAISGQAPDALLFSRDGRPIACVRQATLEERSHGHNADTATLAKVALQQAGFKAAFAKQAVDAALARVRPDVDLTGLIREALRNCG
jgi:hypothetical protein